MRVLVVGAAGDLGSDAARRLLERGHSVRLARHRSPLPEHLTAHPESETVTLDLELLDSLAPAVAGMDAVVLAAGKLFAPNPAAFLWRTNVEYVQALARAAIDAGVPRFVLLSFPQVEGETTPSAPARGVLEGRATSLHARTRLEAERWLSRACEGTKTTAVLLRIGMVYGPGLKLVEGARALLRWRLLAIWREPTWVHLIRIEDATSAVIRAVELESAAGIYNVADEQPLTLQDFVDRLAASLGHRAPPRLPAWCFRLGATATDLLGRAFRLSWIPMNPDILRAGMSSSVADTTRFRAELLPVLRFPNVDEGLASLHGDPPTATIGEPGP